MNVFPESDGSWLPLAQNNPHSKVAIVGLFFVANVIILSDHLNIHFLCVVILCCLEFIELLKVISFLWYIVLCSLI